MNATLDINQYIAGIETCKNNNSDIGKELGVAAVVDAMNTLTDSELTALAFGNSNTLESAKELYEAHFKLGCALNKPE